MDEYVEELATEREMKDRFMAGHPESPFVAERVPGFAGLQYFDIDPAFCLRAKLERLDAPREAWLRTNRDGQAEVRYVGDLVFELAGRDLRLRVFHAGAGIGTSVFVPFRDTTSGRESYGPGRYLTLELNEEDLYDLDFNRAFNPYCAYTDAYECGFPPAENDLPVAVRAGEKAWSQQRNPRTASTLLRARRPGAAATSARSGRAARAAPAPRRARGSRPARATAKGRSRRAR